MLRYRTKALYELVESELRDHVRRHFGAEVAEHASVKGLASGEFNPRRLRQTTRGLPEDKKAASDVNGPQQQSPSVKHECEAPGDGKPLAEAKAITANMLSPRNVERQGHRKPLASVQAHAKVVVTK